MAVFPTELEVFRASGCRRAPGHRGRLAISPHRVQPLPTVNRSRPSSIRDRSPSLDSGGETADSSWHPCRGVFPPLPAEFVLEGQSLRPRKFSRVLRSFTPPTALRHPPHEQRRDHGRGSEFEHGLEIEERLAREARVMEHFHFEYGRSNAHTFGQRPIPL